ncbi:uncharacterized protein DUF664 [Labedaea rhizosphaerae]|uniref:Uncharacterized protein DUF664 n=2 Tax=Labedaea rhizosphaerae TaxID=598644 RepID=A0A4V3CZ98_LABRH|nr:uncharacterized protein DUF664 [Labedaea rhizosphaerae]
MLRAMTETTTARTDPPLTGDERAQLMGFVQYFRRTIRVKTAGLSEEDAHRSVLPSPLMTVAGLVSHLRWVEAFWFRVVLDGQPDEAPYTDEDPDAEFKVADRTLADLLDEYDAECSRSDAIAAARQLDDEVPFRKDRRINLRWVLLHMVEETGRHAGHLDVIREMLDGATGE